jgi:hypothetical protein
LVQSHAMTCFDYPAGPRAGRLTKVRAPWEGKMLGKVLIMSTQIEPIDRQRVISEAVVNGGLTEADSDEAPANELRPFPNWLDESRALDLRRQYTW